MNSPYSYIDQHPCNEILYLTIIQKKKMQISLQALYDATSTKSKKMQKLNLTALTNIINMKNSYLTTL